jgi:hypothetical protein
MPGKAPRNFIRIAQRPLAIDRNINIAPGIRVRPGKMLLDDFKRSDLARLQSSAQFGERSLRRVHARIVPASPQFIGAQIVVKKLQACASMSA